MHVRYTHPPPALICTGGERLCHAFFVLTFWVWAGCWYKNDGVIAHQLDCASTGGGRFLWPSSRLDRLYGLGLGEGGLGVVGTHHHRALALSRNYASGCVWRLRALIVATGACGQQQQQQGSAWDIYLVGRPSRASVFGSMWVWCRRHLRALLRIRDNTSFHKSCREEIPLPRTGPANHDNSNCVGIRQPMLSGGRILKAVRVSTWTLACSASPPHPPRGETGVEGRSPPESRSIIIRRVPAPGRNLSQQIGI